MAIAIISDLERPLVFFGASGTRLGFVVGEVIDVEDGRSVLAIGSRLTP